MPATAYCSSRSTTVITKMMATMATKAVSTEATCPTAAMLRKIPKM